MKQGGDLAKGHLDMFAGLKVNPIVEETESVLSEEEVRLYQEFNDLEGKIREGQEKMKESKGKGKQKEETQSKWQIWGMKQIGWLYVCLSFGLVCFVIWFANRFLFLDEQSDRKTHKEEKKEQ